MKTARANANHLDFVSRISQRFYKSIHRISFRPIRGPYHLTISDQKKFIWFRVAKAGTTTILNHLSGHGCAAPEERPSFIYYSPARYGGYFKFAFVRNPWDRLVSCWLDKVVNRNHFDFEPARLEAMRQFENFVEFAAGHLKNGKCDRHLQSQCKLIDLASLDYLGRLETFDHDFGNVCRRLGIAPDGVTALKVTPRRKPYQEYYHNGLREKVAELYAKDIQIFGYRF